MPKLPMITTLIMVATREMDFSGDTAELVRSIDTPDATHPTYATDATTMLICVRLGRSPHNGSSAQQTRMDS